MTWKTAIWPGRNMFKVAAKKTVLITEISATKKKSRTLQWDKRKDDLRVCQESARLQPSLKSVKNINFTQRLSFEKRDPDHPTCTGLLTKLFPWITCLHVQPSRNSEAAAAMIKVGQQLLT